MSESIAVADVGLYPHNMIIYGKIKQAYNSGETVVGDVQATGTGKSFIGLQLVLDNKSKKTIWVVPSNAIIEHIEHIINNNPTLDRNRDFPNLQIITYTSLVNKSRKELADLDVDILILDEFHHIGAPIWGARINTIIETHPELKIFGISAYTVRDRGSNYERDMANPEGGELFSGKVVNYYDKCDAIIDGVLPSPIYRGSSIGLKGFEEGLSDRISRGKVTPKEYDAYKVILTNVRRRLDKAPGAKDLTRMHLKRNSKCIYFCPPGANLEEIMTEVRSWFPDYSDDEIVFYKSTSADGLDGKLNRDAFYHDKSLEGEDVSDKLRIMFAINQYNEGTHAPNVDAVILGRATSSEIVANEQIGRALSVNESYYEKVREYEKRDYDDLLREAASRNITVYEGIEKYKLINKLLAPVIIDLAGNVEFISELEDDIKDRAKERSSKSSNPAERKYNARDYTFDIDSETKDLLSILKEVRDRVFANKWDTMYELAKTYYETNGNLNVPYDFKTLDGISCNMFGYNLGIWISNQKGKYFRGKLDTEKYKKLLAIGMPFTKRKKYSFDDYYKMAHNYYLRHKNLDVSSSFITSDGIHEDSEGVRLKSWIRRQQTKVLALFNIEDLVGTNRFHALMYKTEMDKWLKDAGINVENDADIPDHLKELIDLCKDRIKYFERPASEYSEFPSSDELYKLLSIGILKNSKNINQRRQVKWFLESYGLSNETIEDFARDNYGRTLDFFRERSYVEIYILQSYLKDIGFDSDSTGGKMPEIYLMSDDEIEAVLGKSMVDIIYERFPKKEDWGKSISDTNQKGV